MIQKHEALAATLADEVAVDSQMVAIINAIIELYQEARTAMKCRRAISRMMLTAIRHEDEKRVKLLVEDWRMATKKLNKYKL